MCNGKQYWIYFLKKALYGLRQASREWHLTLQQFILDYEFEQSKAGPTLFVWVRDELCVVIVFYLDDIAISINMNNSFDLLIDYFKSSFEVLVETKAQRFFGFSVQDCVNSIRLHNAPMVSRVLK